MSGEVIDMQRHIGGGCDRAERELRALTALQRLLRRLNKSSPFYQRKLAAAGLAGTELRSLADLAAFPFTTKEELREAYPLGLKAVPDREVVRIHSSSGTTGQPVIIPYTRRDVADWALMMARCYALAGITREDRIQITPGYGLWTAGIGFQAGAERLGAMAVPMGPGNTEKQLQMMADLESTVLIGTSSYGLLLAEEVAKRGWRDRIRLRKGIFGSERWSENMRRRIEDELGIETFDIYGLTEIYGPGIGIDCPRHDGLHYWEDYIWCEIIDPETGEVLPDGNRGELVITTLVKEGAPLLRYRTRDLTAVISGSCSCGSPYPRLERIFGRSDDMIKVKGVNIFPGQIDELLKGIPGASSEYQVVLTRAAGRDRIRIRIEADEGADAERIAAEAAAGFKRQIGVLIETEIMPLGSLPRSEKKTRRVIDQRDI